MVISINKILTVSLKKKNSFRLNEIDLQISSIQIFVEFKKLGLESYRRMRIHIKSTRFKCSNESLESLETFMQST